MNIQNLFNLSPVQGNNFGFLANLVNSQNSIFQEPQFGAGIGDNSFFSDEVTEEGGADSNLNLNGLLGGDDIHKQMHDLMNENKQLKLQDSGLANKQQTKESELQTKEAELQELQQKQQDNQQNNPFFSLFGNKNNNISPIFNTITGGNNLSAGGLGILDVDQVKISIKQGEIKELKKEIEDIKKQRQEIKQKMGENKKKLSELAQQMPGPMGPHGPQGPMGPQGPHGPQGPMGPQGSQNFEQIRMKEEELKQKQAELEELQQKRQQNNSSLGLSGLFGNSSSVNTLGALSGIGGIGLGNRNSGSGWGLPNLTNIMDLKYASDIASKQAEIENLQNEIEQLKGHRG